MDESAYYATTESNEKYVSGFNLTNEYTSNKETKGNDDDNENVYLGDEWQWNQWEPHNIDDDIEGPNKGDRYEGPHGLRKNISKRFCTVLQCLFETTAMDRGFFVRLCGESNKYARNIMRERNTTLFLGHKWTNITVEEMVHFFGILLRISLEPRKMGGYTSYFQESHSITLASGYTCNLQGYQSWAKNVMNLVRFKQIRSAFRLESHRYDINDKCYQLRWFIRQFNFMAKKTFILGPNASFDEGGIPMRSRFCPVRQYNKDKPAKYRVDFFILADSRDYFIYHLDVYQGKNKANIDIHPSVKHLPTTQKAVANAILKSQIDNDTDGCRYLFMDNRYAAPQLLALMLTNYNIRAVGTCKANRVGFDSAKLPVANNATRGTYARVVDKRLGMVISRWKDSKVLQTVSTVMQKGEQIVKRQVGANLVDVRCPNDIVLYQQNMGGVDRGDQHRMVGAGFANVSHYKKWFKKAFFGIADFCLLQAFTTWNLSVDQMIQNRRGNADVKRRKVIKWEFYSVLAEELMTYIDRGHGDDNSSISTNNYWRNRSMIGHNPAPYFSFDKSSISNRPSCMVCSMDEMAKGQIMKVPAKKIRRRTMARRTKFLVKCMHQDCIIHAHACIPDKSKVATLPYFQGLTCFEIAQHPRCDGLFAKIERNWKMYSRTIPSHSIVQEVKDAYQSTLPRRSTRERTIRPRAGRPPSMIVTTATPNNPDNEQDDSITQTTGFDNTPESNSLQQTNNLKNTPEEQQRRQPRRQLRRMTKKKQPPQRRVIPRKHKYSTRARTTQKLRQQRKRR